MLLAVDDETRNLEAIARALRPLAKVQTARSGEEAWALFQRMPFDIVVSDQRMPGMTGVELLSRVAEQDARVGRVLVTGYTDVAAMEGAINRGRVHCYVNKPWKPQELLDRVKDLADQIELDQQQSAASEELAARNCALEHALDTLRASQQRAADARCAEALLQRIVATGGDFRRALGVISNSADEIRQLGAKLSDARLRRLAGYTFDEAQRLIQLHAELLPADRSSQAPRGLPAMDLDSVLAAALGEIAERAARARVELVWEPASGIRVRLDAERFSCAFLHVARNALEAMPSGGALRVEVRRHAGDAVICVADEGAGVPEEIRERLFDAYVTSGKPGARGLGLTVAREIMQEHHGSIEFEQREERGSIFRLRLPLEGGNA